MMQRAKRNGEVRARPGPRRHRRDGGHLAALEAAFVGMLMVSSIAIYVSIEQPSTTTTINAQREPLEDLVGDLLEGMASVPTSERYASVLEKAISKAVQGDTAAFEAVVGKTMPASTECRLFLDNGKQRRQLAGPTERLARESVSQARLWRPEWSYAFGIPSLDLISSQQPAQFQGYEVAQGALVKEYGTPLQWQLTTDKATYDRASLLSVQNKSTVTVALNSDPALNRPTYSYSDAALTPVVANVYAYAASGAPPASATFSVPEGLNSLTLTGIMTGLTAVATLTFEDPTGVDWPVAVTAPGVPGTLVVPTPGGGTWTMTSSVVSHTGMGRTTGIWANSTALEGTSNWTFQVREEAGYPVGPGLKVNFTFPQVFYDFALTNTTQAGWRNITWGETLTHGAWVAAELNATLSHSGANITLAARRPPTGDALYDIQATLSDGASGKATFVLGRPLAVTRPANTIEHDLYISQPKPHAAGATATWGAVFPNPRSAPGPQETLKTLDIWTTDGSAVFAAAPTPVEPVTGTWSLVSPGHIRWTGSGTEFVLANEVSSFSFKVEVRSTAASDHEDAIYLPIDFNTGAHFDSHEQRKPYVHVLQVPPPRDILNGVQAGYEVPREADADGRGNATANMSQLQRGGLVKGEVQYGVTQWGTVTSVQESMRLGLARSHLNLTKGQAKIGEEINITADFQGLYDEITLLGGTITGWSVEVKVFDPAQPFLPYDEMEPSFHASFGANGQLTWDTYPTGIQSIPEWATTSVQVKTASVANFTMAPPRDAFFGPHAVVVQANFVIQDGLGTSMAQTVRQLAVIDVLPDGGQSGTALYWTILECWLPDW